MWKVTYSRFVIKQLPKLPQLRDLANKLGVVDSTDSVPWREAYPGLSDEEIPGRVLAGARYKENMTQKQLAEKTGIPQRHISEMENGKRTIGKSAAKKFAKTLDVDYRIFL